jgi:hypothetical protein
MTDEEIDLLANQHQVFGWVNRVRSFARALESRVLAERKEQQPVAHVVADATGPKRLAWHSTIALHETPVGTKLFAHPTPDDAQRLDKPAQVGNGRFGVGIKWSMVIVAAQRHYDFMNTPEKEAERIANAKELFDELMRDAAIDRARQTEEGK